MSINIRKIGEEYNVLESSNIIFNGVLNYVHENSLLSKFPLMRGIDYYDNTYFNHVQCIDLIIELQRLKRESQVPLDLVNQIDQIIAFLSSIGRFQYAHFLGA